MQFIPLSFFFWIWLSVHHPFFISLTEMRFNPQSNKMEIAQKIFWDDLEMALTKEFKEKVDFLNPKDKAKLENQLKTYLLKHNRIWVNGKILSLNYLGYEVDDEAAWFYLESSSTELPKTLEVHCSVLLEDQQAQQNIVHVYVRSKSPRSLLLGKGKEKGKLELD
jgi:hypothetical protein